MHLSSAAVTALLWTAYLLGALAVGLGLWRPPARATHWAWVLGLGVLALLTSPFGSADHTNYAAYGRIAAQGGDPYLVPPVDFAGGHDPVTSAVEPPWTMTPSIYGPLATALQAVSSLVGGANLRQTVWAWQVIVVVAWLVVRLLLRQAAADPAGRSRVDVLWTWNPLVFGVVVLGAHVDLLATALGLAAILLAQRRPWLAGLALGAATSTKITYGVLLLAILWSWRGRPRRDLRAGTAALVVAAVAVALPLHLWAGPHVFDQLLRARRSVSLATPWRPVLDWLTGPLPGPAVRSLVFAGAALAMLALAVLLARVSVRAADGPTGSAMRATFVLTTAYSLGAPYSLPWYDAIVWATLPALAATALDGVLLVRLTVMALAYVPGRVVAMSAGVEAFTLGWRRHAAPYVGVVVWAVIAVLAWRRQRAGPGRPPPGPRPPGTGR